LHRVEDSFVFPALDPLLPIWRGHLSQVLHLLLKAGELVL
jgi:hypothetical protein